MGRQRLSDGIPMEAAGQSLELDVMREGLEEWTCSNVLETLIESVKTALETVPQVPTPTLEATLSSLRQQLSELSSEHGLIGVHLASCVHARDNLKSQKDTASEVVHQNRDSLE